MFGDNRFNLMIQVFHRKVVGKRRKFDIFVSFVTFLVMLIEVYFGKMKLFKKFLRIITPCSIISDNSTTILLIIFTILVN